MLDHFQIRAVVWMALTLFAGKAFAETARPSAPAAAATAATAGAASPGEKGSSSKADNKTDNKAESKAVGSIKADAKPTGAEKTDVVPAAKVSGGASGPGVTKGADAAPKDAKDTTDSADSSAATAGDAKPKAKTKAKGKTKSHAKADGADAAPERIGEGPSPASPPPLTAGGLRDEIRREREGGAIDPATPARTKVEQMLAEVTKTRESLHDDTARLEAMLNQDGEGAAGAAAAAGGAAPGGTKPAAKNPLDVLAKALRGIKPEQAAPIVSRLDKRLAATVLQRMPPVDAGKILGAMKADTAAELATQIAMRAPLGGEAKR